MIPKEIVIEVLQYVSFCSDANRNYDITEQIATEEFVTMKDLLNKIEYSIINSRYKIEFMKFRLKMPEYEMFKPYFQTYKKGL